MVHIAVPSSFEKFAFKEAALLALIKMLLALSLPVTYRFSLTYSLLEGRHCCLLGASGEMLSTWL